MLKKSLLTPKKALSLASRRFFSNKSLYMWLAEGVPGTRLDDYKNLMTVNNTPRKIEFFEGKSPSYVYTGPRHNAVILDNGELYTFGSGNWGVLGHGNEASVSMQEPRLVEYFAKNNIKLQKICLGDFHSLALDTEGQIYTWGYGGNKSFFNFIFKDAGALGHGDSTDIFTPKRVNFFVDQGLKIKDIASGIRHSVALTTCGKIFTWGRGDYGLLGNGNNWDSFSPVKNEYLESYFPIDSNVKITKIDCADEYTGVLTSQGDVYVWGKNNNGQLGIGTGIGVDLTESEKFPVPVLKPSEVEYTDFSCGENGMMLKDQFGYVHKTGWSLDYVPSLFNTSKEITCKYFFCGNSYYCMIDEHNQFYQWGELFKKSNAEKSDNDMNKVLVDFFSGGEVLQVSGRFKVIAVIVKH